MGDYQSARVLVTLQRAVDPIPSRVELLHPRRAIRRTADEGLKWDRFSEARQHGAEPNQFPFPGKALRRAFHVRDVKPWRQPPECLRSKARCDVVPQQAFDRHARRFFDDGRFPFPTASGIAAAAARWIAPTSSLRIRPASCKVISG